MTTARSQADLEELHSPVDSVHEVCFRIDPVRPVEELLLEAQGQDPPVEEGSFRASELVNLHGLDPDFRFDIRYATTRNFLSAVLYSSPKAYLQRPAAEALCCAAEDLREEGFGLIIFDAYRPWYVTKIFWEATPESQRMFVAPPDSGSRHNRGAAVDITLYDLTTGARLRMPSGFDEFTERAHAGFSGGPSEARRNRDRLRAAMERHDFTVNDREWWHFEHADWPAYPILNHGLDELD